MFPTDILKGKRIDILVKDEGEGNDEVEEGEALCDVEGFQECRPQLTARMRWYKQKRTVRATLPLQFLVLKSRSSGLRTIHTRDNPRKG